MSADPPAVSLRGLSFRYRGAAAEALAGVDLAIPRGSLVAVLGATGAGKSTLCQALLGLVPSFFRGDLGGEIVLAGAPASGRRPAELARAVAIVFQDFEAQLFTTDVELEVAFGPESYGAPREEIERRVAGALARTGLAGFEGRAPSELSGGEKQRLAIASALAMDPALFVLDEPTTDLDPIGKADVMRLLADLKRDGRTIVIVEHETEELAIADRVVVLERGRVAREGGSEVLAESDRLEAHGVRPPELPRLFARLGLDARGAPIADAAAAAAALSAAGFRLDERAYAEVVAADPPPPAGPPLLEARALRHAYEGRPRPALDGVSLAIAPGEFLAILGGNGSGKSTLARHLNGLLPAREGEVLFAGEPFAARPRGAIAREVGYVFQNPDHQIFSASVEEEVAFGPRNFGLREDDVAGRVARALETVGLAGRGGDDPFALPKGDRQRLAVASVLAMDPRVILMDEPTTGLDYRDQRRMMALLARLHAAGRTVIVITHHIWIAVEYARRVVLMAEGQIVADAPVREVMRDAAALARARVTPPPITRLGLAFGAAFRTGEEAARCLVRRGGEA
jgi:energy-coupling factor transport system ATP-binding protein